MKEDIKVSVIISIYDYKEPQNLKAVIKSINKQTIDTEVIISEQGENKSSIYKDIAENLQAKYILTKPEYKDGKRYFNIGKVRNVGASIATGQYYYFNDADVLLFDNKYLENILTEMNNNCGIPLSRPSIYRLSRETSQIFIDQYLENDDLLYNVDDKEACLVDYHDGFIRTINGGEAHGRINDMPYVCTQYNYDNVVNNNDVDYTKIEEFIWSPTFHYGGTLCVKDVFWKIGGYCEKYYNWGLEDEDIHWKLKETTGLLFMYDILPEEKLMHFEHNRKYNNDIYDKNHQVFQERVSGGVKQAISNDTLNKETFVFKYLNKMYTEIIQDVIIGREYYNMQMN